MIAGLVQPSAGDIVIDGVPVTSVPTHKRNLGMLFQNYALFPHLNVLENVSFGLSMRGVGRKETQAAAERALALVRLSGFETRMPAALSGGQQQRVALARAIVYRPRVLLLDEPFGALDRKLREEMQIELRQLCRELSLTTVLVTHDQEEALVLADRIAVMRAGRIEQVASARAIYDRPATRFVADFIGASNFLPARITGKDGGRTILDGNSMTLESLAPHELPIGARALIAIRPEAITLAPGDAPPYPNSVSGRVLSSVFKGQSLSVRLEHGAMGFEVVLPANLAATVDPKPGELWTARWPAERALVLAEQ
jgi:ABC-type Fe3+/spermidine/putrescine transport system ATPase subunit